MQCLISNVLYLFCHGCMQIDERFFNFSAEEWISGRNASPILMSLKAGSRIRTYKPVVYKPSENSIVASDKNNDRKFMFLSEETQPDYRPMDMRMNESKKPCPRIDHRPLGADSYSKVSIIAHTITEDNIHLFVCF